MSSLIRLHAELSELTAATPTCSRASTPPASRSRPRSRRRLCLCSFPTRQSSHPPRLIRSATNLIGQSQSGTGKTAAFALNMLSRVDPALMTPQAICLAPSRELARQIQNVIDKLGQFTEIKTFLAVPREWRRGQRATAQILVGTPGTLVDMLGSRFFDPKQIRVFVLDEADEMIQLQGLGDQTFRIKK